MSDDENIPKRVREAEARRAFRELLDRSSLGTPGAVALRKIGAWTLGVPGAKQPTAEDQRLADEEIKRMDPS